MHCARPPQALHSAANAESRPLSAALLIMTAAACLSGCAARIPPAPPPADAAPPAVSAPAPVIAAPPISLPSPTTAAEDAFLRAREALLAGDAAAAGSAAENILSTDAAAPWKKRALFLYGRTLLARDRTSEAAAALLRVPDAYPELADYALFLLAERYAATGLPDDAISLYQRLISEYPSSLLLPKALFKKAQAQAQIRSFAEAASSFETLLRDFPRAEPAADAGLGLARARAETGDLAGAARAFLDASVKYPGNGVDAEVERGLASLRSRGVEVPKLTADQLYERGRNLFRALQYERAYDAFTRALEAAPSHPQKADILLRSGVSLFHAGRRAEAAGVLERLLKAQLPECRCAEALHWTGKAYSRLGMRDEAVKAFERLARTYPDSDWADDALYLAGNVFRDAEDRANAVAWYRRLAAEYPDSSFADSALWWDGWSSYQTGEFSAAIGTWQDLVRRYPRSFLAPQALFWQGRAADQRGETGRAQGFYRAVLERGPYTYYGRLAGERLADSAAAQTVPVAFTGGGSADEQQDLPAGEDDEAFLWDGPLAWTDEAIAILSGNPAYRRTLELMYQGMKKEAAAELWSIGELMPERAGAVLGLSKAFFELEEYYSSLIIVLRRFERQLERPSSRLPEDLWLLAYPQGFWPSIAASAKRYGVDPYFIAAVIREESQFRPEAVSPAGARGVMQIMPSTGEWVARTAGIGGFERIKLFDADLNISIGAWYLKHLIRKFGGDLALVAAAYNAGPEPVLNWTGRNLGAGDPALFVEMIPYMETRGYVKRVLRNYAEYRRIYGSSGSASATSPQDAAPRTGPAGTQVCAAAGPCP